MAQKRVSESQMLQSFSGVFKQDHRAQMKNNSTVFLVKASLLEKNLQFD
jgi:hypothetical protein